VVARGDNSFPRGKRTGKLAQKTSEKKKKGSRLTVKRKQSAATEKKNHDKTMEKSRIMTRGTSVTT